MNENSETVQLGFFQRIGNVIFEPGKVFESIIEKPKALLMVILLMVIFVGISIVSAPISENFTRNYMTQLYTNENFLKSQPQVTKDNADEFIEKALKYSKIGLYASPVITLFYMFIQTLAFFLLFKIFGGIGTFAQTWSGLAYSYVIASIGMIVKTVNIVLSGNIYAASSPAIFMTPDTTSFIYNFINKFDIFNIWFFAILAFGLSIIHKVSSKKAYIGVFSIWFVVILIMAGATTIQAVTLYNMYGIKY